MPCRHDLTPTERRKVLALNVAVVALKTAELALIIRAGRRRREADKVAAAMAGALVAFHTKEN